VPGGRSRCLEGEAGAGASSHRRGAHCRGAHRRRTHGSECRRVRRFPLPFWPVKKETPSARAGKTRVRIESPRADRGDQRLTLWGWTVRGWTSWGKILNPSYMAIDSVRTHNVRTHNVEPFLREKRVALVTFPFAGTRRVDSENVSQVVRLTGHSEAGTAPPAEGKSRRRQTR